MQSTRAFLFCAVCIPSASLSCLGDTGGELIEFEAYAAGPATLDATEPYRFRNGLGYDVTLAEARLHIGAVYLNQSRRSSVSADSGCQLAGIYVAEVPGGVDVDILNPSLQKFSVSGFAESVRALTGEVWLMGGDVTSESDPTVILRVRGTAERDGDAMDFEGELTIDAGKRAQPEDPALPGKNPICKSRIVTPITVDLTPISGGQLVVRIDPAGMFANVDFDRLEDGVFRDDSGDQPSANLYAGMRAAGGVYSITWESAEER
jgi:hypothetical protein